MSKTHEADAAYDKAATDAIRRADYFLASLFIGRGEYITASALTVLGAMRLGREIEKDERAHSRKALIYAVSPDGHATMLPAALIQRLLDAYAQSKEIKP